MNQHPTDPPGNSLSAPHEDGLTEDLNDDEEEEQIDPSPFLEYLKSPQGHEIAGRVVGIIDDVKKAALSHTASEVKLEKVLQIVIFITVVVAATALAILDKFSAPVGILFGTLVGYVFGRKAG